MAQTKSSFFGMIRFEIENQSKRLLSFLIILMKGKISSFTKRAMPPDLYLESCIRFLVNIW